MRIDLRKTIKDYEGKDALTNDGKTVTYLYALSEAINGIAPNEILTAEQKSKIYQLSIKLYANKEVDLTLDDRSFIKQRAGIVWNALVYGKICELLEDSKVDK